MLVSASIRAQRPVLPYASHFLPCHRCTVAVVRAVTTAAATAAGAAATQTRPGGISAQHGSCPAREKHYVVVGAGLAGLATAYHLLAQAPCPGPVRVTLYDAVGIGAGGSGAAAGLLHPFAPTGKLLWRAEDAMVAALELLEAAEAAAATATAAAAEAGTHADSIAWRTGMLKPATSAKQSKSFWKLYGTQHQPQQPPQQQQQQPFTGTDTGSTMRSQVPATHAAAGKVSAAQSSQENHKLQSILTAAVLDAAAAQQLLPGVQLPVTQAGPTAAGAVAQEAAAGLHEHAEDVHSKQLQGQGQQGRGQQQQQQRQQHRRQSKKHQQSQKEPPDSWEHAHAAALHAQGGITLQPLQYMQALWTACQHAASARQDGSSIQLKIQQLHSIADILQSMHSSQAGQEAGHAPDTPSTTQPRSVQQQQQQQGAEETQPTHGTLHEHTRQQQRPQQQQQQQRVDAVIVAAGAAVGSLQEIGQQPLPLTLCQGYTLDMVPPAGNAPAALCGTPAGNCAPHAATAAAAAAAGAGEASMAEAASGPAAACDPLTHIYPAEAPSLLGSPYLASQGGRVVVVGATKRYACTTEQAVAELGRVVSLDMLPAWQRVQQGQQQVQRVQPEQQEQGRQQCVQGQQQQVQPEQAASGGVVCQDLRPDQAGSILSTADSSGQQWAAEAADVSAAADELLAGAAAAWPPIRSWSVAGIRSGVRALPPRSAQGAVPIAGRWGTLEAHACKVPVWLLVGLGARGLVYHAWLGKLIAAAVLQDSEAELPPELLGWRVAHVST